MAPHTSSLCTPCVHLLDLIDPLSRCRRCFNPKETPSAPCHFCHSNPLPLNGLAAAFEYLGPAASLIKKMKYGNRPYLAKEAAAFMTVQWSRLDWPFPDLLLPIPLSWNHWLQRGYNQSHLLAKEMSALMQIPLSTSTLKRRAGGYSQAGLSIEQRRKLHAGSFSVSKGAYLEGKSILLIDDVTTSRMTLRRAAESIQLHSPKQLHALLFCC